MNKLQHSITFIDHKRHRSISYDNPKHIDLLDNGAVRIRCEDGFATLLKPDEWERIEIERCDYEL